MLTINLALFSLPRIYNNNNIQELKNGSFSGLSTLEKL